MRLPKPYLAITAEKDSFSTRVNLLGRKLTFGADSLPSSIKVHGC